MKMASLTDVISFNARTWDRLMNHYVLITLPSSANSRMCVCWKYYINTHRSIDITYLMRRKTLKTRICCMIVKILVLQNEKGSFILMKPGSAYTHIVYSYVFKEKFIFSRIVIIIFNERNYYNIIVDTSIFCSYLLSFLGL